MIAPILKGRKTTLKPMEPKHAEIRFKWYSNPKVAKYQNFGFSSKGKLRENIIKRRKSDKSLPWIILAEDKKLIGEVQLREINRKDKRATIAINIGETEFWNKGYATDAIQVVNKYFFTKLKYNRVELNVESENIAGINCYTKCGFKKEAILRQAIYKNKKYRDLILMSLIKDDYQKIK